MANKLAYYESDIKKFFKTTPLSLQGEDSLDGLIVQKLSELKILLATRALLKGAEMIIIGNKKVRVINPKQIVHLELVKGECM